MNKKHDVFWGVETEKAFENFNISRYQLDPVFIKSFCYVKLACCQVNSELGYLDLQIGKAIDVVCNEIISGKWQEQIIVNPLQGGAGTSTNMNFNEVIANLAMEKLNAVNGDKIKIDPLAHVNLHQSTNDVYPTALKVAVLFYYKRLEKEISNLQTELQSKEMEFKNILKLGRTQLQDALPMTLGMTFGAMSEAIARDRWRIFKSRERIKTVNLGGTAIGTGLNAPRKYIFKVAEKLRKLTGLYISRSENLIDSTQNLDSFVEISGMLKACAVNLLKISNDLRLMSSGPGGGFAEIVLPANQKGSTIMPGKINPVIPEMIAQVAIKVISNDNIVAQTAAAGNLELSQFIPLLGFSLLESLEILSRSIPIFTRKCIQGIVANKERALNHVNKSKTIATVLVSKLGYEHVEQLIHKASEKNTTIEELIISEGLMTKEEITSFISPASMYKLGYTDEKI